MKPEEVECILLVEYLDILLSQSKIVEYSHTAQETYTKSWQQKRKNKRMGVRSGVPDYIIITPTRVLFIEMKRLKGGRLSLTQKHWIDAINNTCCIATVANGFQEAKKFLEENLQHP